MKIVFYISSLTGGGAERVLVNLMNYLSDQDENVVLVVNHKSGPYLTLLNRSIKIHELNARYPKHSIFELKNYLNRNKPDLAVSTLYNCNFALILAGKLSRSNCKILVREANSFITRTKHFSLFRLLYERLKAKLFYPLADEIFVNSEGSRSELAELTRVKGSDIRILKNPLDFDHINKEARKELPKKIAGFIEEKPLVVAAGRLTKAKGFDVLIKAFRLLKNEECRLVILGEGDKREELQKLIDQLDLCSRIFMPGYIENPYSIMDRADLFVLSSRNEGMPNVLLEAMSLGVPLVATDCPSGPRELLQDGKFGCLVPVDDEVRLAEAIDRQLGADEFDKEERRCYIKQFDSEQIGSDFYSLLQRLTV